MPQTLIGWILIAAVMLSGAGGGHSAARAITGFLNGPGVDRRDVVAAVTFVVMLIVFALLLLFVDGR